MNHQAPATPGKSELHCPECKSTRLSIITESTVDSANAVHTPVSRRVGVTTYSVSKTNRNYWMCHSCGTKFRNIQNLKAEISRETKQQKTCLTCFTVFGVISILLLLVLGLNVLTLIYLFLLGPALILFLIIGLSSKNKVTKLTEELEYLQVHCFN